MRIGVTMPVVSNFDGAVAAINTIRSTKHWLDFHIVSNQAASRCVAASWNLGCDALFGEGLPAVVVANDDILCARGTVDAMVDCWLETKASLVTGVDVSDRLRPEETVEFRPKPPFRLTAWPDFSFFLLPRETWERVGRFDENFLKAYFEDDDYQARGALLGLDFVGTTAAPFYHYGGVTLRTGVNVSEEEFEENRRYFVAKWGAHVTSGDPDEMRKAYYATPFNDPSLSVRDCPRRRY